MVNEDRFGGKRIGRFLFLSDILHAGSMLKEIFIGFQEILHLG
jgi:hypothetical protein